MQPVRTVPNHLSDQTCSSRLEQFRACVEHALAALLQRSPQVGLAARHVVVAFDKAVEEAGQLFACIRFDQRFLIPASLAPHKKGAMREWYIARAKERILPRVVGKLVMLTVG